MCYKNNFGVIQKSKTEFVTKLQNLNCDKTLNSNCDHTQKLKLWQNSKTFTVTKIKIKGFIKLKTKIMGRLLRSHNVFLYVRRIKMFPVNFGCLYS